MYVLHCYILLFTFVTPTSSIAYVISTLTVLFYFLLVFYSMEFLSVSLLVYLIMGPSFGIFLAMCVCLSVCLSVPHCVCLSLCLSVRLFYAIEAVGILISETLLEIYSSEKVQTRVASLFVCLFIFDTSIVRT